MVSLPFFAAFSVRFYLSYCSIFIVFESVFGWINVPRSNLRYLAHVLRIFAVLQVLQKFRVQVVSRTRGEAERKNELNEKCHPSIRSFQASAFLVHLFFFIVSSSCCVHSVFYKPLKWFFKMRICNETDTKKRNNNNIIPLIKMYFMVFKREPADGAATRNASSSLTRCAC